MSLSDWLKNAWLIEHETSPQEIADLLSIIDRDLNDCRSPGLSSDWKMAIAYNAVLHVAIVGLAVEGYSPRCYHSPDGGRSCFQGLSATGISGVAPARLHTKLATRLACSLIASRLAPLNSPKASTAVKASPAPTVSTTSVRWPACRERTPGPKRSDPRSPSVSAMSFKL